MTFIDLHITIGTAFMITWSCYMSVCITITDITLAVGNNITLRGKPLGVLAVGNNITLHRNHSWRR